METLEIRSTSARTAESSPIVLRETDQVRLVFLPTLVDNQENRRASIKGTFVYQRKGKNDEWTSINTESLTSIKKGESFKLELHTTELLALGDGLRSLYELQRDQGLPRGRQTFVKLEASLARFFALGEQDLRAFLDAHSQDAVTTLLKIVKWVAGATDSPAAAEGLASISTADLPAVATLLGLAAMKRVIAEWERTQTNPSEEYWQTLLGEHSAVLSQIFAYPIVVIAKKAYVGGKRLDNKGGKVVDFLARAVATRAAVLIEIKTPMTQLLGKHYRNNVSPLSPELNGAIAQVVHYRQSLTRNFAALAADDPAQLTLGEPRCVVIAGTARGQLTDESMRNNFEILRERVAGVTVVTFDELFSRVKQAIGVLEESTREV